MHAPTLHVSLCDFPDRERLNAVVALLGQFGPITIATSDKKKPISASLEAPSFGVIVMYANKSLTKKQFLAAIKWAGARCFSHPYFIMVGPADQAKEVANALALTHHDFVWIEETVSDQKLLQMLRREFKLIRKEIIGINKAYLTAGVEMQKETAALSFEKALKRVIKANYHNPQIRTVDLAKMLGVSVSTLERKTLHRFGRLPKQLLTDYRLQKVKEALETGKESMQTIASKMGFSSAQYMSVRFQEIFGVKPSVYRAQHQQKIAS